MSGMSEVQHASLAIKSMDWFNRTHIGRTSEEKQAYLEGIENALLAVFEDTSDGSYSAVTAVQTIDETFEEGEERRKS
jgi:hypothetical protein